MQDALLPIPDIVGFQGSAALAAREKAGLEALKRDFLRDDPAPKGIVVNRPYAESVWVHDCVSRRAAAVASVPLQLKRNDDVIESHPVLDLLGRRTNCGNLTQFLLCTEAFHALDGEVFWLAAGARGLRGEPERLFVVSGRQMRHETVGDDEGFEVLLGWIFTGGFRGRRLPFLPEEVGQLARFNPYNNFRGLSALVAAGLAVQQDVGAKKWNLSTLVNDAEPGGILTADGAPDDRVIDSIREQWRSRHEGIDNKRRIAVLYGGLKWQQISATAQEIAWVEGQQISREEICAALGVLSPEEFSAERIRSIEDFGVFRSQANRVPLAGDKRNWPRRTGGLTVFYPDETDTISESELGFDRVAVEPIKYATLTPFSSEFEEDAIVAIGELIALEAAQAFAEAEDNNGFNGDGTSAFARTTGILNSTNVQVVQFAATKTGFDDLTELPRNAEALSSTAPMWMPWNYRETSEPTAALAPPVR